MSASACRWAADSVSSPATAFTTTRCLISASSRRISLHSRDATPLASASTCGCRSSGPFRAVMLPGKKLTVQDIMRLLRRRAWLVVVPPLLTVFPALIYSSRIPNVYESDMLIAIDPQRVPDAFVRSTVTLGTDLRMEAISVKVRSRTNLQRMIDEFNLYPDQRQRMQMEDVVRLMNDSIKVTLEKGRDA